MAVEVAERRSEPELVYFSRRRRVLRAFGHSAGLLVIPILLLIAWQITSALVHNKFIVASPMLTFRSIGNGITDGWLLTGLGDTLKSVAGSFAVSAIVGSIVGVALGLRSRLFEMSEPVVMAGWAAPKSILYPIFILLFGIGAKSAIVFAATWGVFPVVIYVMNGVRRIPRAYLKLCRSLGVSPVRQLFKVVLPATSLDFVVALRYGWSLSFLGIIVMEMFGSYNGIGRQLIEFQATGDMPKMLASATTVVVVTVAISIAFYFTEHRLAKHRGADRRISMS